MVCALTYEDLLPIPTHCPILNIKLTWRFGEGRKNFDDLPSIDKILPYYPYIPGNARWVSHRANTLKSNATLHELECLLRDAQSIQDTKVELETKLEVYMKNLQLQQEQGTVGVGGVPIEQEGADKDDNNR